MNDAELIAKMSPVEIKLWQSLMFADEKFLEIAHAYFNPDAPQNPKQLAVEAREALQFAVGGVQDSIRNQRKLESETAQHLQGQISRLELDNASMTHDLAGLTRIFVDKPAEIIEILAKYKQEHPEALMGPAPTGAEQQSEEIADMHARAAESEAANQAHMNAPSIDDEPPF